MFSAMPACPGGVLCVLALLSCSLLLFQPAQGQGQGQEANCTCNITNSRCDESGVCRCDPGWDGELCETCEPMPGCVHGSCHQPWQCSCQPGWTGRFCDKDVHVCANVEPCQNGATCLLEDSGDYSCLCPEGFHGRDCQLKTGPCFQRRSPCRNGGLCEDDGGYASEPRCRCLAGFGGPRCQTDLDDCLMQPCANGATCLDGVNRFSCVCPPGFSGRFCTVNLDDCAGRPCRNGGRCLDGAGAFQCLCPPGFAGKTCEREASQAPVWTSQGWERGGEGGGGGGGERTTQPPTRNASRNATVSRGVNRSPGDGDRLFKISVKEVVTQQGAAGLSEVQLIVLVVLGAMTMAVVLLTAGLVLGGHWRDRGRASSPPPPRQPERRRPPSPPQDRPVVAEQEFKVSFLEPPGGSELEKKRRNAPVI